MKKSYVILSLLLTAVLVYVFSFLYLPKLNTGVSHRTGRIDISTSFKDNEKAPFIIKYEKNNFVPAEWMKNNKRFGYVIENKKQRAEFEITANRDCDITLNLRGPWILKDKNNRNAGIFEQWIDFKRIKINGKNILKKVTPVWHNKPFNYTFKIRQNETIHLKARWKKHYEKTDISLLFIVLVLSFLFSYKVVKYLASFKVLELRSRIDIVFLSFFAVILFLPMSNISTLDKSTQENRMLAKKPHFLLSNAKINTSYGTEFENWFNDRFFGREKLMKLHTHAVYSINKFYQNQKAIYNKVTGWMYNKPLFPSVPSEQNIKLIIQNLQRLDQFCVENNIKLYVLLVPKKEAIYKEDVAKLTYKTDDKVVELYNNKYISTIKKAISDNRIIYPYDELKQGQNKDYVFFKQAHHWTDWGAYLGYQKLIQRIQKDFTDIHIVSLGDYEKTTNNLIRDDYSRNFNKGHTTNLLNLNEYAEQILTTEYTYYDHKNKSLLSEVRGRYIKDFENNIPGAKYRLFLTGTSHNEDLLQFLPYSVQTLKYVRWNLGQNNAQEANKFMKHYKNDLLKFKPDILVLTIPSVDYGLLTEIFKD